MENWIVLKNLQALVNHQLLWHDSHTTGIFSQGLRIPPPEAPVVSSLSLTDLCFMSISYRQITCLSKMIILLIWFRRVVCLNYISFRKMNE